MKTIYLCPICWKCEYDCNPVIMGGDLHYRNSDGIDCMCDLGDQTLEQELENCRFLDFDLSNYLINFDGEGDGWFLKDCEPEIQERIKSTIEKYYPDYFKTTQYVGDLNEPF